MSIRQLDSDIPKPINLGHFDVKFKTVEPYDEYDKSLVFIEQNRDVKQSKVNKLKKKIGMRGFVRTAIILITPAFVEDGNEHEPEKVVADAQHGIQGARESNSMYYAMELEPKLEYKEMYSDPAEVLSFITELNTDLNNWKPWDFVLSFAKSKGQKYSGYRFMRTLQYKNPLFVQADIAALCCDGVTSLPNKLKKGEFSLSPQEKKEINSLALQLNRIEQQRPFGLDGSIARMRNSIIKVMRKFANLEGYNITYQEMADFIGSRGAYNGYKEEDNLIEWKRDMTDLRRQLESAIVHAYSKGIFDKGKDKKTKAA